MLRVLLLNNHPNFQCIVKKCALQLKIKKQFCSFLILSADNSQTSYWAL
jgi:hypothetical protein